MHTKEFICLYMNFINIEESYVSCYDSTVCDSMDIGYNSCCNQDAVTPIGCYP